VGIENKAEGKGGKSPKGGEREKESPVYTPDGKGENLLRGRAD